MTLPSYSTGYSSRPAPGRCWVCHRPDSVPVDRRGLMPELCGPACEIGWVMQCSLDSSATHEVEDDEWVPLPVDQAPDAPPVAGAEAAPDPIGKPVSWLSGLRARWAQ